MTDVPPWLRRIAATVPTDATGRNPVLSRFASTAMRARQAAVLVLFGGAPDAVDLPDDAQVLLTQRAATMRKHSGQVAFPGGATDPDDDGPVDTALREAHEETGLDPAGVQTLSVLPKIFVPPSRFDVTPVVAYWRTPSPVGVVDAAEADRVMAVPLTELIEPANRFQVRHPLGYQGPAFAVDGTVVWGFTGGILAGLIGISGWEQKWDVHDVRDLNTALEAVGMTPPVLPAQDSPSLRNGEQ